MKTKEQIKNDYAKAQGYEDYSLILDDLINEEISILRFYELENEAMEIYAKECLKLASENATIEISNFATHVHKESITNENNIIK